MHQPLIARAAAGIRQADRCADLLAHRGGLLRDRVDRLGVGQHGAGLAQRIGRIRPGDGDGDELVHRAQFGLGAQHEHRQAPGERGRDELVGLQHDRIGLAPHEQRGQQPPLGRAVAGQPRLVEAQAGDGVGQLAVEEFGGIGAFDGDAGEVGRRAQHAALGGVAELHVERGEAERIDEILEDVIHGMQAAGD